MDTKILIADDDPIVHESLKIYLEAEGFKTVDCYDGISAIAAADSTVSLCVLDIMMPGKSGIDVCREIRKTSQVPIVMLTAKGVDLNSYTVLLRGEPVICTPKEIEILFLLASNPGHVFTRDTLLSKVWGYDFAGETRTVDTHIKRLRAKLDSTGLGWSIKTIYGVGYKFELE